MNEFDQKQKIQDDIFLSVSICVLMIGLYITNIAPGLEAIIYLDSEQISTYCKWMILISLIVCVPAMLRRFTFRMLWICIGTALVYSINRLCFPAQQEIFGALAGSFVTTILPAVICFLAIRDYTRLIRYLIILSYVLSGITVFLLFTLGGALFGSRYSMGFSNMMIFPTELLLIHASLMEKKPSLKLIAYVLAAGDIICVGVYGSRGALAAIAVFFIFLLIKNRPKSMSAWVSRFSLILIMLIVAIFFDDIVYSLNLRLVRSGFHNRTLQLLIKDIGHDSGRYEKWKIILSEIASSPGKIRGICADRLILDGRSYTHNVILELAYSFGVVLSIPMILQIAYYTYYTVIAKWNSYTIILTLTMFSFLPLYLWSGTVWTSMYFWIWVFIFRRELLSDGPSSPVPLSKFITRFEK